MVKKKIENSSARMKAAGKSPSLLWLDADSRKILDAAALADRRPLTQFLIHHGLTAARKILAKKRIPS